MKAKHCSDIAPLECGRTKPIPGIRTTAGWFIRPTGPGLDIGEVYLTASQDEATQEAYARLFTRSPDLLEALRRLATAAQNRDNSIGDPCRMLEAKEELLVAARHAREVIERTEGTRP